MKNTFLYGILFIFFMYPIVAHAAALPDWITDSGSQMFFKTNYGNTIIYSYGDRQAHLTDLIHNGVNYGGLAPPSHDIRSYSLYEAYYFDSGGNGAGTCHQETANVKHLVYSDNTVAVIESGCTAQNHVEMWRYIIPRNQSGLFETERKDLKVYLEAQNDQQVQFLNTSVLSRLYSSTRNGGISGGTGYSPLFTQFSRDNMPFEWTMGYDPVKNVSLAWIHTGSDSATRTALRRYPTGSVEQQVDFAGAGEASKTEMPLGPTWIETWKGIVNGNQNDVKSQALSLVGHMTDEQITPFFSVATVDGKLAVKTGSMAYEPKPYLSYDIPYASDSPSMITEYPYVNGAQADTGSNLTSGEDPWNSTYRNLNMSYGWLEYTAGNGSYKIRNQRTAYKDADGLIWNFNITALNAGNMTFSVKYGIPSNYNSVITDNTFSIRTIDPIEGEYGLTFIFPESITVTPSGSTSTVTLSKRSMNAGETVSYTIYAIPHKWSNPVSPDTFHTREKTTLKIPYRVLQTGLEWLPVDTVTAYEGSRTDSGYTISAYSEAGSHKIQIYSDKQVKSLLVDTGSITYSQSTDGTISGQWTVPNAAVGKISLVTSSQYDADFITNTTSGYSPLAVKFMDVSDCNPTGWSWDFGDGNRSEEQNPVFTYSAPGNYSVNLTVTDPGRTHSVVKTAYITVNPPLAPLASFTSNVTTGYAPLAVQFTDQSTGTGPLSYAWDFTNDGIGDSTARNTTFTYTTPGTYSVNHTVTNAGGSAAIVKTSYIRVNAAPLKVYFTSNVTTGTSPLTVQFNDTSTGNPTAWTWLFDDGTYGYEQNPVHTYSSIMSRNYTVTLVISTTQSKVGDLKTDYIKVNAAPVAPNAAFTSNVTSGSIPLAVQFADQSTGTGPLSYAWDFTNDGIVDTTSRNPTFVYDKAGSYSVNLTVTNAAGFSRKIKPDYLTVTIGPGAPVAMFTSNATTGNAPLAVQFTDQSTGTGPLSYAWDFTNDGIVDITVKNATFTYTQPGTYSVNLSVTNSQGSANVTKISYIRVNAAPLKVYFTSNVTTGTSPLTVQFNDTSTGNPTGWTWLFGDGTYGYEQNPIHTYSGATSRNYTVTLVISTAQSKVGDLKTDYIRVNAVPVAPNTAFTSNVTTGAVPLAVQFTDQSTGTGQLSYAWDFTNDGIVESTSRNPTFVYDKIGSYTVNLTVTNAAGFSRKIKPNYLMVTTGPGVPVATFTSNVTTGNAPLAVQFTDQSTGTGPLLYTWDFTNDGIGDSTARNATFIYTTPGTYSVNHTVTNAEGSSTIVKTSSIKVNVAPLKVYFTSNVTTGTSPLTVQFNDTSTGNPTAWTWLFGDGTYGYEQNPIHTYSSATSRNYTVTLVISTAQSKVGDLKTDYIRLTSAPIAPVVAFTSNVTTGAVPLVVQFTDQSTGTGPLSYAWDFTNDGIVESTSRNPTFVYDKPGSYAVNLTVTNAAGFSRKIKPNYLTVSSGPGVPVAMFTSNVTTGNAPLVVQFTDQSTGTGALSYAWDFTNDGIVDITVKNATFTYTQPGMYSVNHTVTNAGASAAIVKTSYIRVNAAPLKVYFTSNATTGTSPLTVQFNDTSTGNPTAWTWLFGDGTYGYEQNPIHTYSSATSRNYTVTLVISTAQSKVGDLKTDYIHII